jgi:hypothetical protein
MVLVNKPGTRKLYPFYPEGQKPPGPETNTTPIPLDVGAAIKKVIGSRADYSNINFSGTLGGSSKSGGTRRRNHKKRKTRKY